MQFQLKMMTSSIKNFEINFYLMPINQNNQQITTQGGHSVSADMLLASVSRQQFFYFFLMPS